MRTGFSSMSPKVFGDYTLLTTLAEGGQGSIHLAKRVGFRADIQRFLVVKKLRRTSARDLRRFEDEARIVVTLNHRALCHVFDVGIVDDEHYLAMELVEGVTLQRAAAAARFSTAVALYIIDEMLDALDYAHQHRDPATGKALHIVHRDVSPQNVMLSFSGAVKLIDFGLVSSTLKQERTVGGVVVGKLEYMAPEQARAEPLDARSDVYAAAIIAYELLTGRRFYEGLSQGALMTAVVDGTHLPSFDGLDPALIAPLQKALAGEREDRTPSCAILQAELAAALPRASSRDLRDALQRALPDEQARLEALVRSFLDVAVDAPDPAVATSVKHIARSDENATPPRTSSALPPGAAPAGAAPADPAAETREHRPGGRDISTEPTRIERRSGRSNAAGHATTGDARALPAAPDTASRAPLFVAVAVAGAVAAVVVVALVWIALAPEGGSELHVDARAQPDTAIAGQTQTRPSAVGDGGSATVTAGGVVGAAGVADESDAGGTGDVASRNDAVDAGDDEGAEDAPVDAGRRVHKAKARVRPPNTPLPDLAAHLDYLARWCAKTPCSRSVLAARGRIPVLDVVGLRTLRRDAEACVAECRR